jgi:hypothetical protein
VELHDFMLMHSSEEECVRLREKWRVERELRENSSDPNLGGINKISEKGVTKVMNATTGWLEQRIENGLAELDAQRSESQRVEREREKERIRNANNSLRLALGESFLKNAGVSIANGVAAFKCGEEHCTVHMDAVTKQFLLNGKPVVANVAGGLDEKITASLIALADAKRVSQ